MRIAHFAALLALSTAECFSQEIAAVGTCHRTSYNPRDIAASIQASNNASDQVKRRSCMWGGAGQAESGGNVCAHNAANFGILQLSKANVQRLGLSPEEYLASSLQDQVDGWALTGAPTGLTGGYGLIDDRITKSLRFGHLMDGPLAACSQFGGVICKNDVDLVEAGKAVPIAGGPGAIPCTDARTCNHGTANQDGNGQSIISWGLVIETRIQNSQCVDQ